MSKISTYILFIGLLLSLFVGGFGMYAEWTLNSPMEYEMRPEGLIFLFFGRVITGAFPFIFIVGTIELFRFLKRKLQINQVSKWSKYISLIGLILGFAIASIGTYAEWDLNPQMEYTLNPEDLILIFFAGLIIVQLPFIFVAGVVETFRFLKGKLWQTKK